MISGQRKLFFSFVVAAAFLAPLLTRVHWGILKGYLQRIDFLQLVIGFFVLIAANILRSFRFVRLDEQRMGLSRWWIINNIYNAITATLPGGVGEAVTAYAMKKTVRYEFFLSFRILILSRVMDLAGISVVLLFAALLFRGGSWNALTLGVASFFLVVSVVLLVPATERFIMKIARRLLPAKGGILGKIAVELERLSAAIGEKRGSLSYGPALAYSLSMIICSGLSVHLVLHSLGIHFSLVQSLYCFGVYALFQLVPLQGFAGIGTQAAWWAIALNAAGHHPSADSASIGIVLHGIFYLFIGVMALLAIAYWRLFASKMT